MRVSASQPDFPMTATAEASAAPWLARFQGLRGRLAGADLPWLARLREEAAGAFAPAGIPTRRSEAWRYTDLRSISGQHWAEPLAALDRAPPVPIPTLGRATAVLVDGRFRREFSSLEGLPHGMRVRGLADVLENDPDAISGRLGAMAALDDQPLAALNTMLFEDGVVVELDPGVAFDGVLHIASLGASAGGRAIAFQPRFLVALGQGATLTLAKTGAGVAGAKFLDNPVTEIMLAAGSRLRHVRMQDLPASAAQLATTYVRLGEDAAYEAFVLAQGAGVARSEIHVALEGPRARCHVNAAQLLDGARIADTTTVITHAAPDCASRQTCKTVLAGASRGVFQGRIHVHRAAQKTDGYQMNQALLLSPEAEMDSKPQLEIYADDVKCSHGATVGELDEQQMFYLRSRGVPADQARALLVQAFLEDAMEPVTDDRLRAALAESASRWWQGIPA
jgi:Fe-S cluster assembly protein SufD